MIATPLILLGQLLGLAVASGLNLYATVALLGLASRLSWIPPLPAGLRGLESEIVIASAAVLFLIEFVVDKVSPLQWLWDTLHTLIRPLASALLTYGALGALDGPAQVGGALAAGAVTLAVHGSKAGLRVTLHAVYAGRGCWAASLVEDLGALLLAFAALLNPAGALMAAGALLVMVGLVGRRLWRASLLGLRALGARVRGFFSPGRWRGPEAMAARLRSLVPERSLGSPAPRATRAAVDGLPGVAPWRNGWLVLVEGGGFFVYRAGLRVRRVPLPKAESGQVARGVWADALTFRAPERPYTLYLLKDGPAPETVLAELVRTPSLSAA